MKKVAGSVKVFTHQIEKKNLYLIIIKKYPYLSYIYLITLTYLNNIKSFFK